MDDRDGQVKGFVREWAVAERRHDAALLEGALTTQGTVEDSPDGRRRGAEPEEEVTVRGG
jgi:hypothetical protein